MSVGPMTEIRMCVRDQSHRTAVQVKSSSLGVVRHGGDEESHSCKKMSSSFVFVTKSVESGKVVMFQSLPTSNIVHGTKRRTVVKSD